MDGGSAEGDLLDEVGGGSAEGDLLDEVDFGFTDEGVDSTKTIKITYIINKRVFGLGNVS